MTRCVAWLVVLAAFPAFAQEARDLVEDEKVREEAAKAAEKLAAEKALDGWQYKLDVGFNIGYNHSDTVVGQVDGHTLQLGIQVNGAADLYAGQHEWHNTLSLSHQQTKTPSIEPFVKTNDNFELMTMWLYKPSALPWLGPFARARMQTSVFRGRIVYGEDKNLSIRDVNGNVADTELPAAVDADGNVIDGQELLQAQAQFELTRPFEPLLLRQSLGAFARALDRPDIKVTFTAGLGAQEIFTREGFAIDDNPDTKDVIEIKQLQDSLQLGIELGAEAGGTIGEQITWGLNANTLYPFVVEADTDLEGIDLTNVELGGKIGVKLAKWASLDYVLSAKRVPLILNDWQIQNGLLLSTAFNLL